MKENQRQSFLAIILVLKEKHETNCKRKVGKHNYDIK